MSLTYEKRTANGELYEIGFKPVSQGQNYWFNGYYTTINVSLDSIKEMRIVNNHLVIVGTQDGNKLYHPGI